MAADETYKIVITDFNEESVWFKSKDSGEIYTPRRCELSKSMFSGITLKKGAKFKLEVKREGNSIIYSLIPPPKHYYLYESKSKKMAFYIVDNKKVLAVQFFATPQRKKSITFSEPNIRFISRSAYESNYNFLLKDKKPIGNTRAVNRITEEEFKQCYNRALKLINDRANISKLL